MWFKNHAHQLILLAVCLAAFLIRVVPLYHTIFTSSGTILLENDPYYHMRLAQNLAYNFPFPLRHDTFLGNNTPYFPFVSYLIYLPSLAFGCSMETWAAWISPIAFVLLLIVVYKLGKALISKWAGVLAAFFCAIIPTELYDRSLLGFSDHHVLEVLFVSMMFLYLIYANQTLRWKKYGLLGGVALSFYTWSWLGFPTYLFIFTVISVLVILYTNISGKTMARYHLLSGAIGILALAPLQVDFHLPGVYYWSLILYMLVPFAVYWLKAHLKTMMTTGILLVATATFVLAFWQYVYGMFTPVKGVGDTIQEATPAGTYIIVVLGLAFIPYLFGMYRWIFKYGKAHPSSMAIVLWSLVAIFMVCVQLRWSYYLSVPYALVVTAGVWYIVTKTKQQVKLAVAMLVIFLVAMPGIAATPSIVSMKPLYAPELREAMVWLKENTPEYSQLDPYYNLSSFDSPYKIMSWWDNGFFIMYGAHRVPVTDPTQRDADIAAEFFVNGRGNPEYVLATKNMTLAYPGMVQTLGGTWAEGEVSYNSSFLKQLVDNTTNRYKEVYSNKEVTIWQKD